MPDTETQPEVAEQATQTTPAPADASTTETAPIVAATDVPEAPPEEDRPVFYSHLLRTVGQFLGTGVDKAEDELTEEYKHLRSLFFQHVLLANAINSSKELTEKVLLAVSEELARITAENGAERPAWVNNEVSAQTVPEANIISASF